VSRDLITTHERDPRIATLQSMLDDAAKHVGEQRQRIATLEELLERCAEFLDGYSDVVDGAYGEPEPNKAMSLVSEINEAIT
jgi:hypothetical protein